LVSQPEMSEPPVRSVIHCPEVHCLSGSRVINRGMTCSWICFGA
jgi:hypothetical protein